MEGCGKRKSSQRCCFSIKEGLGIVKVDMLLPTIGASYQLIYTINGAGRIQVEASYSPEEKSIPLMPKFGMRMRLPAEMKHIKWYGRGEFENYPDRKSAAFIGCYERMSMNSLRSIYTRRIMPIGVMFVGFIKW